MDPIAHTFTGAALAATGLRRATPLATAALVIGANAPDIDVLASFAGSYAALALRRGWTHGVLAIVVLPFMVTGLLLLWDRMRPGRAERAPARAGPLLALAALAVLTHPTLDWLNNYGMRWLMPFDGRWSYGDALFIVDPWVWLALGGVLFLGRSRNPWAIALWVVFWLLGTWLLFSVPLVPAAVTHALGRDGRGVFAVPAFPRGDASPDPPRTKLARIALGCVIVVHGGRGRRKRRRPPARCVPRSPISAWPGDGRDGWSRRRESVRGHGRGRDAGVLTISASGAGSPSRDCSCSPQPIERRAEGPIVAAASRTPAARDYLTWSRYPYFEIETRDDGYVVRLRDARYHGLGGLEGPDVHLDGQLEPLAAR